ncbi:26 kDa secreted antigen [Toxocara canis]|uniref:26 kDa secreted antigen n=1 Tax=Toxocara canis TaxID=6265 RepID=A0A0B2UIK8_TOXCA|nr:26 kDa secreted antigen [Toxocara canis]
MSVVHKACLIALLFVSSGVAQQCMDSASDCAANAGSCFTRPVSQVLQNRCQRTCNTCDCRDEANNCAASINLCQNPTFEPLVRDRCQKTCGLCAGCGFISSGIVPLVVTSAPSRRVSVTFANNVQVNCGNTLTTAQVANQPTVTWEAQPNDRYTLIMVDPDFPSAANRQQGQRLHWWVINIPGNNIAGGTTLAAFQPSTPAANTGVHRYVFLVYRQPAVINSPLLNNLVVQDSERPGFGTTAFATQFNLGSPYAGNFYRSQA